MDSVGSFLGAPIEANGPVACRQPPNFDRLFALLPDMVVVTTLAGRVVWSNRAFLRVLGWAEEELTGASALDFIVESDRHRMADAIRSLVAGEPLDAVTVRMHRKDAGVTWVEWVGKRADDYLYATGRNVSALLREANLVAAEQRLLRGVVSRFPLMQLLDEACRSMETLIPDGFCSVLLIDDGGRLRLGGCAGLPLDIRSFLHGLVLGPNVGTCGPALRHRRRMVSRDLRLDPNWQEYRWIVDRHNLRSCCSTPLVDAEGAILGTLCVFGRQAREPHAWELQILDRLANVIAIAIERQRADVALTQATAAAETGNRAKSQFIATMSHELRTPLNAVIGFAEFIAQEHAGPIGTGEYVEAARDIRAAGEHLLRVINDILDLSKFEAGFMELDEEKVDLAAEVAAAARMTKLAAESGGLTVALDLDRSFRALRGDARRIRQIVLNLLSNAINHTPPGGTVTVKTSRCPAGAVTLAVTDTGVGIAPEHLAIALEPFGQVDSYRKVRGQGTGLGLPVSKRLAEAHAGTLDLASTPGVGTTVTVTFPAERVVD